MEVLPFTPNYLKRNNACDKNRVQEKSEPTKKRTEIKNAIKTAEEVDGKIAEVVKKKRGRPFGSTNKKKNTEDKAG